MKNRGNFEPSDTMIVLAKPPAASIPCTGRGGQGGRYPAGGVRRDRWGGTGRSACPHCTVGDGLGAAGRHPCLARRRSVPLALRIRVKFQLQGQGDRAAHDSSQAGGPRQGIRAHCGRYPPMMPAAWPGRGDRPPAPEGAHPTLPGLVLSGRSPVQDVALVHDIVLSSSQ